MSTSNLTIDEKYDKAILSLKKINNELFYDDLKKIIQEREQTIAELNDEVYESVEKMQKSMKRFPIQVSEQLKEEVIVPQNELFDRGMERFDDHLVLLEKKISYWNQVYQDNLVKTEKLLADAKGLQQDDQEFIVGQTERITTELRNLQEQIMDAVNAQAAIVNVKYEAVSDRLGVISQELGVAEEGNKAEFAQINEQLVQDHKNLQEKLKQSVEDGVKREGLFKKWLIGLAVGQGVSIVLMVLFFILK
ncbi:hypothetical protein [Neobacillus sp. FSL H8-0543]|uniref:hypothetical protein n=1 Tax=Neobacillus sp. FSL H8-0543 TaxID=2954672 RepID=UPI0031593CDC